MKNDLVCGFCGTIHYDFESYVNCVSKCADNYKKTKEEEANKKYLEEMNAALNGVKEAKKYYEEKLNAFKEKYPNEYDLNFKNEHSCGSDCKCKTSTTANDNDIFKNLDNCSTASYDPMDLEITYLRNGNEKPVTKINGKEIESDKLKTLFNDPNMQFIAKMLGI